MAWETRKGKGRYYTRTLRKNGGFVRQYVGTGPGAELAAAFDTRQRAERMAQADARKAEQARWRAADGILRQFDRLVGMLVHASLLAAGYHQHDRGEWRRKHDEHEN
jgi:hypothetical protein